MRPVLLLLFVISAACNRNSPANNSVDETDNQDQTIHVDAPAVPVQANPKPAHENEAMSAPDVADIAVDLDARTSAETVYFRWENNGFKRTTADQSWLLAVKRTQFQTNSGTSGTLGFGAASAHSTDFDSVSDCQTTGLTYCG